MRCQLGGENLGDCCDLLALPDATCSTQSGLQNSSTAGAEDRREFGLGSEALAGCNWNCLLYTSDAADERSSVDLGGRRIIKKNKNKKKKDKKKTKKKQTTNTTEEREQTIKL